MGCTNIRFGCKICHVLKLISYLLSWRTILPSFVNRLLEKDEKILKPKSLISKKDEAENIWACRNLDQINVWFGCYVPKGIAAYLNLHSFKIHLETIGKASQKMYVYRKGCPTRPPSLNDRLYVIFFHKLAYFGLFYHVIKDKIGSKRIGIIPFLSTNNISGLMWSCNDLLCICIDPDFWHGQKDGGIRNIPRGCLSSLTKCMHWQSMSHLGKNEELYLNKLQRPL